MYSINRAGALRWRVNFGSAVRSSPALSRDGNTLYVGCNDGKVRALTVSQGTILWTVTTQAYVESSAAIDDDNTIIIGSADRNMYALQTNGAIKWKFLTRGKSALFDMMWSSCGN